jgi:hypothetical protein
MSYNCYLWTELSNISIEGQDVPFTIIKYKTVDTYICGIEVLINNVSPINENPIDQYSGQNIPYWQNTTYTQRDIFSGTSSEVPTGIPIQSDIGANDWNTFDYNPNYNKNGNSGKYLQVITENIASKTRSEDNGTNILAYFPNISFDISGIISISDGNTYAFDSPVGGIKTYIIANPDDFQPEPEPEPEPESEPEPEPEPESEPEPEPEPEPMLEILLGDVNSDDIFNSDDLTFLAQYVADFPSIASTAAVDPYFHKKADVNKDNNNNNHGADVVYMVSALNNIPGYDVSGNIDID